MLQNEKLGLSKIFALGKRFYFWLFFGGGGDFVGTGVFLFLTPSMFQGWKIFSPLRRAIYQIFRQRKPF